MCAQANPFLTLACLAAFVYMLVLLAWVIVNWITFAGWHPPPMGPTRKAIDLLDGAVRPALTPLRKVVPPAGVIDLSVMVAFVILFVIRLIVCGG